MARVETKVYQLSLSTSDLRKLDDAPRRLLLLLGHAANEIAALYRAAHASGMDVRRDADRFTWQIAQSQTLLMLRLAGSKMYELFQFTKSAEHSRMINMAFPDFPADRRTIERRLAQHMDLHKYRNRFGFHYDAEIFSGIDASYLDGLPEGIAHEIVFEKKGDEHLLRRQRGILPKVVCG